jgi:hypothetical protein
LRLDIRLQVGSDKERCFEGLAYGTLWVAGRVLIILAVAVIVAGIAAEVVGAKVEAVYSSEIPVSGPLQAAALMVWSPSSAGKVTLDLVGAKTVYYIKVRGDPTSLLAEAGKVGIKVKNENVYHDFRGGVLIGQATLEADPLLIAGLVMGAMQTGKAVKVEGGHIVEDLDVREGLIVVALPDEGVGKVSYTVDYRIEGYSRARAGTISAMSVAMAALGFSFLAIYRRANA